MPGVMPPLPAPTISPAASAPSNTAEVERYPRGERGASFQRWPFAPSWPGACGGKWALRHNKRMPATRGLLAVFHPEFALPAARPVKDKEPQVTALAKRVLRQFSRDTADFTLFTHGARAALFPARAKEINESLNTLSLPVAVIFSALDLTERRDEGGLRVYRYVLTDLGKTLFCTIKLTKDDKIADLQLREG